MKKELKKYWHTEKGFINPEGNRTTYGFRWSSIRWILSFLLTSPYKLGKDLPREHIMLRDEALSLLNKYKDTSSLTWLGHASFLLKINGMNILTDPFLFGSPGTSLIRAFKRLPNPFKSEDLNIDTLFFSHQHQDHIHHPSLKSLKNKLNILSITPLGVSKKLKKHNFKKLIELDWFDTFNLNNNIKITAVPAVHYSNFLNTTLWAGFIVSFKENSNIERKIYFSGDTGYGPFIKRDVAPYGPFDVAIVGVGAFYLKFPSRASIVHTNPEQAVNIAKEISAKKLIGMHWGTLRLASENPKELFDRMKKQAEEINYTGEVKMLRIGESVEV